MEKKGIKISTILLLLIIIILVIIGFIVYKNNQPKEFIEDEVADVDEDDSEGFLFIGYTFSEGVIGIKDSNDKVGYIDTEGNIIIDCIYADGGDFSEGLVAVSNEDEKWGYIDKQGNVVIDFKYDFARDFSEGLACVYEDDSAIYIDKEGNTIISNEFNSGWDFSEGYALVSKYNGDLCFINKNGEIQFEDKFNNFQLDSESFKNGLTYVYPIFDTYKVDSDEFSYEVGYIGVDGEWKIKQEQKGLQEKFELYLGNNFSEGISYWCKRTLTYPKENKKYKKISDYEFDAADDVFCIINENGEQITDYIYKGVDGCSESRIAVMNEENKWGFVDKQGNQVVDFLYEEVKPFSEGLAAVKDESGNYGFIDTEGNVVIDFKYYEVGDFSDGVTIAARYDGEYIIYDCIDKEGNEKF